jgi:predicted amidohydrolase
MAGQIGTLRAGAWGDAVVLDLEQGRFELRDSHDKVRIGSQRLIPTTVVRAGKLYREPSPAHTHAHHH